MYYFQFSHITYWTFFFQIITTMRTLYQKCKLVHGDLSEYNILYFEVVKHLNSC
jgi:serine/threonine-protein kinase RIO1